jgi:hypothetical protein
MKKLLFAFLLGMLAMLLLIAYGSPGVKVPAQKVIKEIECSRL